jgi:hypothetical protein
MKTEKRVCSTCVFHDSNYRMYREYCEEYGVPLLLSDEVINWIILFGCASWKPNNKQAGQGGKP